MRNKLSDEHQEYAHERLSRLIDGQEDFGSGNKLTGGGGPVSMLGYWEQLLDNEVMGPNRKSAELMQKIREVRGLHSELQRVGK